MCSTLSHAASRLLPPFVLLSTSYLVYHGYHILTASPDRGSRPPEILSDSISIPPPRAFLIRNVTICHSSCSPPPTLQCLIPWCRQLLQKHGSCKPGELTRKFDTALPGKYIRLLYNSFKHTKAGILTRLRTGMSRLNGCLYCINAAQTDLCLPPG